jgi:S1-C subfamily serine protease
MRNFLISSISNRGNFIVSLGETIQHVKGESHRNVGAQQGLELGDVILNVNGSAVSRPFQVREALADAKSQNKHDVLLKLKARKGTVFIAIPLAQG